MREPKNEKYQIIRPACPITPPDLKPSVKIAIMKIRHSAQFFGLTLLLGTGIARAASSAENWENHCTKCHGDDGKGQTKAGKKLQLKDYSDAAVQAKMKDDEMAKTIAEGIFDKGKEKMKAYKDELSADEIKDLVAYIRKLKA